MQTVTTPNNANHTTVTCSRCQKEATVPFVPTPGRPIYCRDCFSRQPAAPRGPMRRQDKPNALPPRRMLGMKYKGHFVYDAMAVLEREDAMDESQRRAFVEMIFTRGSRQTTSAAHDFIDEKIADDTLTTDEGERLNKLLDTYSRRR